MNKEDFKVVFDAGMKCNELHPDDDSYDSVHFEDAIKKTKSYVSDKRKDYIRKKAILINELSKGFTETEDNAMKAALEMAGYIEELT